MDFYDASVGFSVATQGRIGIASFEGGARTVVQGTAASKPPIQQNGDLEIAAP